MSYPRLPRSDAQSMACDDEEFLPHPQAHSVALPGMEWRYALKAPHPSPAGFAYPPSTFNELR